MARTPTKVICQLEADNLGDVYVTILSDNQVALTKPTKVGVVEGLRAFSVQVDVPLTFKIGQ